MPIAFTHFICHRKFYADFLLGALDYKTSPEFLNVIELVTSPVLALS
jgi:hypothetical protein